MKNKFRKEDYPKLFNTSNTTAEKYLPTHSPQEVVEDQNKESADVWKGVLNFMKTTTWRSYIIEGVAILPEFAYELGKQNQNIISLFLIDENEKRLNEIIHKRGLWDKADKYSDSVKSFELLWLIEFNKWLKAEASTYKQPVINVDMKETILQKALDIVEKR